MILRTLEDAVTAIKDHGSLAALFVGQFGATMYELTLYAIEPTGILRRYQLETTTALVEPPKVTPVGDVVGTGWQNFTEVFGAQDVVVYAFSTDGAVDWHREDNASPRDPQDGRVLSE